MPNRIHEFHVGYCTHPSCMVLKGSGFASRCFPSRAYLIETQQGFILLDTGYSERFYTATQKGLNKLYALITPVHFDQEQSLLNQLEALGLKAHDIKQLVISHFHADHIAGLRDFPNAQLICSQEAWKDVRYRQGIGALRRAFIPTLLPNDIESRLRWMQSFPMRPLPQTLAPYTNAYDISGQGETFLIDLPGHAVGHIGMIIQESDSWRVLAGDAAWTQEGITHLRGPSELSFLLQHSRRDYYQTLEKLHRLSLHTDVRISLSHQE